MQCNVETSYISVYCDLNCMYVLPVSSLEKQIIYLHVNSTHDISFLFLQVFFKITGL